jgi:hypothetical protein
MKTLAEEREAIVEAMRTMPCKACGGDGYTVEYDTVRSEKVAETIKRLKDKGQLQVKVIVTR